MFLFRTGKGASVHGSFTEVDDLFWDDGNFYSYFLLFDLVMPIINVIVFIYYVDEIFADVDQNLVNDDVPEETIQSTTLFSSFVNFFKSY